MQNVAFTGYIATLTTQFMAGSPPDIVHIPLPTINLPAWAEADFLVRFNNNALRGGVGIGDQIFHIRG